MILHQIKKTAGGAPYGFTLNGTSYFYLLNLQGDVIGIYDSNGTVVVQYVYDSWGKLISITGSMADTVGVKNPLRYRGYYYDTLSGLYYLQSRYYDPETGRFLSSDTLLIAGNDTIQGTNLFAYCINNPVIYVDYSGHCYGYPNDPNLNSSFSGVPYGYNCGSYGRHVRNPRAVKPEVSVGTAVGYASDGLGMLGTELVVAATKSSKLTNVGGGIWNMQTTIPKVALAGKTIGKITTGLGLVLTGMDIADLWINRNDLSSKQKAIGTIIDVGEFGASIGVGSLASTWGLAAAVTCASHPLLAAGATILGVSFLGGMVIYGVSKYFSEKVGL